MANPTVADLVAALLKLPQDAEVECLREYQGSYYTSTEFAPVDIEYGITLLDYTKPGDEKYACFGRKIVHLESI